MKLGYEDKVKLYEDKQNGLSYKALSIKYGLSLCSVQYLVGLIQRHGYDVLRTSKNRYYSPVYKEKAILRVITNKESIWEVSLDLGLLSRATLSHWIVKYKENGNKVVDNKRGKRKTK